MPHGITQVLPATQQSDIPAFDSARVVRDFATLEGCKRWHTRQKTVTNPGTNWV